MTLENYIDDVCFKECEDVKDKAVENIIVYLQQCDSDTLYLTKDSKPYYIFTSTDILNIFTKNKLKQKIGEYISENPKQIDSLKSGMNILDAYYYMRSNRFKHIPIVDNSGRLTGEISFKTLSVKLSDIVIKDSLTGVYNQKYFEVLLEEYNEFNKPLGIIFIDLKNINILEGFYGSDKINKLLKFYASSIKSCVRDIDFVFRVDYEFKILTFNNLEITKKILKRVENRLKNIEFEDIRLDYKTVYSHVPELENNVVTAIESCEKKLIERD